MGCLRKRKTEVEGVSTGYVGRGSGCWRELHNKELAKYPGDEVKEKRGVGETRMGTTL
jgi:hypothetical protein